MAGIVMALGASSAAVSAAARAPAQGKRWTPDQVGEALIAEFRALPKSSGIYSPVTNVLQTPAGATPRLAMAARTVLYLERDSIERKMLLTWANLQARDGSVAARCREMGWTRARFYRRVAAAKKIVADGLNRDALATSKESEL